jgi:hypothetical protein
MRPNIKFQPPQSTTFERARASLDQIEPPSVPFKTLVAAMASALDLLESPRATEARLKICHRAIEQAEQRLSPWATAFVFLDFDGSVGAGRANCRGKLIWPGLARRSRPEHWPEFLDEPVIREPSEMGASKSSP